MAIWYRERRFLLFTPRNGATRHITLSRSISLPREPNGLTWPPAWFRSLSNSLRADSARHARARATMLSTTTRILILVCSVILALASAQSLKGAVMEAPSSPRELLSFASMPGSGSETDCEDGSNVPVSYSDTGSSDTDCENGLGVPVSYTAAGSSSNETDCENGSGVPVSYSLEGSDCENGSTVPVRY